MATVNTKSLRLTRCDSEGVPTVVQLITHNYGHDMFVVTLFDGRVYGLMRNEVAIGSWSAKYTPRERDYQYVEELFLKQAIRGRIFQALGQAQSP